METLRRRLDRGWRAARPGALALAALGLVFTTGATAAPRRIVSLNACADAYLIALADKSQVAALTRFARDPQLSFFAEKAKAYPYTGGQAEAVLVLHPDLVIASPYRRADTLSLIQGKVKILDLKPTKSFEDVVKQTRLVAKAIGQPERGEALIQSMKARVDAAGRRPIGGVAVQYQRGGFISGPGSLIDDLMTRAGLVNLARLKHEGSLGQMSLEQIVYAKPDFLVLSEGANAGQDEGSLIMDHPALAHAVPEARRLHVPTAFTVCGGPSYPDALERMQAEADRAKASRAKAGRR